MVPFKPEIHCYPGPGQLSEALAGHITALIREARIPGHTFNMALSGGSTPGKLFEQIAAGRQDGDTWSNVRIFWVDERCVPPDHPESNYGMTHRALLKHIDLSEDRIHRMRGEADPAAEARRYEGLLRELLPKHQDWPVFDLVLLGMGTDGHTASIFPDQMNLLEAGSWCAVALHPESAQHRITLTGRVINRARRVYFMVTGRRKSSLVQSILRGDPAARAWPAAQIKPYNGQLAWFLDEDAAGSLDCHSRT